MTIRLAQLWRGDIGYLFVGVRAELTIPGGADERRVFPMRIRAAERRAESASAVLRERDVFMKRGLLEGQSNYTRTLSRSRSASYTGSAASAENAEHAEAET
jgi:hypothetical protein